MAKNPKLYAIGAVDLVALLEPANKGKVKGREAEFRDGNLLALFDEVLEYERAGKTKPEWARKALIEYLQSERFLNSLPSKIGRGQRPSAIHENNLRWFDLSVFQLVNYWMGQKHESKDERQHKGLSGRGLTNCEVSKCNYIFRVKARRFSWEQACKHAANDLKLGDWQAVRRAYLRVGENPTRPRGRSHPKMKKGFYASLSALR